MTFRLPFLLVALGGLMWTGLAAQPDPPPDDDELLAAVLEQEIAALSSGRWTSSASLVAAAGWRDNVLLSAFSPEQRGFGRFGLEAGLFRPRRGTWGFTALLTGDLLRYISPPTGVSGEQDWLLQSEVRWTPSTHFRLAAKAAGYWQDTVIDQSESEQLRFVAPTQVSGGFVTLAPRLELAGVRVEPWAQARRNDYRGYSGDYDEPKYGFRLEWPWRRALVLSGGWSELHRRFDHRIRFTIGGRPLPGTRLRFRQRETTLAARTTLGREGTWSLGISGARLENTDEASSYFDYVQRRVAVDCDWRRGRWRIAAWVEGARTEYRTQTVGTGIAPPARVADDYETVLRAERALRPGWSMFGEHRWERSRSNLEGFGYRGNTVQAGLRRDF